MKKYAVILGISLAIFNTNAYGREQIRIVGSSTVFPFTTTVAENFGRMGKFRTPIVESTGTGGGIKLWCGGVGTSHPDAVNASRAIKSSEIDLCRQNGVTEIIELKIGYDGIVIAQSNRQKPFGLTTTELWLALAKTVPVNGQLVPNPYKTWNQINPNLPADKIEVFGPPPTSGTRDSFVELVMDKGCQKFPVVAQITDAAQRQGICQSMREDGAYIEAGENDNLIVRKLQANPKALGIFGYSFLEENSNSLHGLAIDNVAPNFDTIAAGQYNIARPLYVYVKKKHFDIIPGLREFMLEYASDRATGDEGYLTEKGLIPLPTIDHQRQLNNIQQQKLYQP